MPRDILLCFIALVVGLSAGCETNSQSGALLGGLGGAGLGAIIGHQFHNTAAGAVIGAGAGAVTGALVGNKIDQDEAKQRAAIAAQLGRPISPGAVHIEDVAAMTHAGVGEDVMINLIVANGVARPMVANDVIYLKQSGVSDRVIEAMQAHPPMVAQPVPPPPVVVDGGYYDPYWGPRYYHPYGYGYYHRPPPPGIGVTIVP